MGEYREAGWHRGAFLGVRGAQQRGDVQVAARVRGWLYRYVGGIKLQVILRPNSLTARWLRQRDLG